MDRLLSHLGPGWAYELSLAGRSQRVAILCDATAARRETCREIEVAEERIGGDMNASRYDSAVESFRDACDADGFAFRPLAPADGTLYDGIRLAGRPLRPKSQIDYLFASGTGGGLSADLTQAAAHVHVELLPVDFAEFRRHLSDHIPVTIRIRVRADDDPGT